MAAESARVDRERDVTLSEVREANVLQRRAPDLPSGAPASLHASPPSQDVRVSVLGRPLVPPEHALREGLSLLRLSMEGYVGPRDYAEAVALTLAALATSDAITFPV